MQAPTIIVALAMILGVTTPSAAQPDLRGAVELSNGTKVPQKSVIIKTQPHKRAARANSQGRAR